MICSLYNYNYVAGQIITDHFVYNNYISETVSSQGNIDVHTCTYGTFACSDSMRWLWLHSHVRKIILICNNSIVLSVARVSLLYAPLKDAGNAHYYTSRDNRAEHGTEWHGNLRMHAMIIQNFAVYNLYSACLASPYLAVRCLACWRRALPCLAVPCRALPCLAVPCRALPCLAVPCRALPFLSATMHNRAAKPAMHGKSRSAATCNHETMLESVQHIIIYILYIILHNV